MRAMKHKILVFGAVVLLSGALGAQTAQQPPAGGAAPPGRGGQGRGQQPPADPRDMGGGRCAANPLNCADAPNPLPAPNTVWIEEMTWMDVRDAIKAGKTTVIIPSGGIEPNGPWLVTGKHNYVLKANCDAIARKLGNALCAPIIEFVPEGGIDPPTSHMRSPGTISVREETFRAVLTDVAHSLKMHGFKNIIFIGDSGGNQAGPRDVAEKLNAQFKGEAIVAQVDEYYDYNSVARYMESQGVKEGQSDNLHDDPIITLNMFIADPKSVRYDERLKAKKATINGFDISDRKKATELARKIVEFRANATAEAINKAIANKGSLPRPARGGRGAGAAGATGAGGAAGATGLPAGAPGGTAGAAAGQGRGQGGGGGQAQDPRTMGGGNCAQTPYNCSDTPNPLPAANTVWIEEMTWMDVRDALKGGKTTAIISTGGMEPNGPWLVTGKHNYVLRANCDAIARKLGNALCAPIVELVPEGRIEPPSGHMRSAGTISLRQDTYEAMLTDIAHSLKMHGFQNIVFIGDSGGNQSGQDAVAKSLNAKFGGKPLFIHVGEYYTAPPGTPNVLRNLGVTKDGMPDDGLHDSPGITLNMMLTDPESVRYSARVKAKKATINGVDISNLKRSLEWARAISDARAARTVDIIKKRMSEGFKPTS